MYLQNPQKLPHWVHFGGPIASNINLQKKTPTGIRKRAHGFLGSNARAQQKNVFKSLKKTQIENPNSTLTNLKAQIKSPIPEPKIQSQKKEQFHCSNPPLIVLIAVPPPTLFPYPFPLSPHPFVPTYPVPPPTPSPHLPCPPTYPVPPSTLSPHLPYALSSSPYLPPCPLLLPSPPASRSVSQSVSQSLSRLASQ